MQADTTVSRIIGQPAAAVWAMVRNFGDYRWGEGVGAAEVDGPADTPGAIRDFAYYGQPSRQRLVALDDGGRTIAWESVEAFDPSLAYYRATVRVMPVTMSGESFIEWSVVFDATADAVNRWRHHQQVEFAKSLDRLAQYVDWKSRGLLV